MKNVWSHHTTHSLQQKTQIVSCVTKALIFMFSVSANDPFSTFTTENAFDSKFKCQYDNFNYWVCSLSGFYNPL